MNQLIHFNSFFLASDFMQSIGKIYVVVAVLVAIFLGLAFMLYNMDRRLKKLELKNEE